MYATRWSGSEWRRIVDACSSFDEFANHVRACARAKWPDVVVWDMRTLSCFSLTHNLYICDWSWEALAKDATDVLVSLDGSGPVGAERAMSRTPSTLRDGA
ncbi:unnamed protein product [Peniophora sp. CBMAI 1063]|nr:unnamed protein product [Peniophora sp. CBMAI 1063]